MWKERRVSVCVAHDGRRANLLAGRCSWSRESQCESLQPRSGQREEQGEGAAFWTLPQR